MKIPGRGREGFVREVADTCLESQRERIERGLYYTNYFLLGADQPENAAMFNKTFAYIDDLESLLYSPVSLRFHIGDPDTPNILDQAKGRAAATNLRHQARRSNTDTKISEAVGWSLVKGKTLLKQNFKRGLFSPDLIQPESFGVFRDNYGTLDEDMEAFVHSQLITPYQFNRIVWEHPDRDQLIRRAKKYQKTGRGNAGPDAGAMRQVIAGGFQPFQPQGSASPAQNRGIVNWLAAPNPMITGQRLQSLLQLDEVWIWDDNRTDWTTFQLVGDDILIMGKYQEYNAFAWNPDSQAEIPDLKGKHPFNEFCPNRMDGTFWGRSEIVNVALLQEGINARINGTNRILRMQENPPRKFVGSTGVNQAALSRFSKPGGFWVDANPNAKIDTEAPAMPPDLWGSLHEFERMFDEMGGLPPIAKGHGEQGVRSQGHAETLVRMFTPRFKDRALLVERDVEGVGATMLELARCHIAKKLTAWVPEAAVGAEKAAPNPLVMPPAPGLVPVVFSYADLEEDVTVMVDSHSSSPAFAQDAKSLIFDLLKIGAMDASQVVEHVDSPDPEGLIAGIARRGAQRAAEIAELEKKGDEHGALKLIEGNKGKR